VFAKEWVWLASTHQFGFVVHIRQESNLVLLEGTFGKGYFGGISELL
jgi:hypothetical protein